MQATMSQFTEELTGSAKKKCGVIGASQFDIVGDRVYFVITERW